MTDYSYETGMRMAPDQKTQLYRVGYDCPNCQESGYRYGAATNEYTKCRGCGTKIAIWPAHPDGIPNRDEHGDYLYGNIAYPK